MGPEAAAVSYEAMSGSTYTVPKFDIHVAYPLEHCFRGKKGALQNTLKKQIGQLRKELADLPF